MEDQGLGRGTQVWLGSFKHEGLGLITVTIDGRYRSVFLILSFYTMKEWAYLTWNGWWPEKYSQKPSISKLLNRCVSYSQVQTHTALCRESLNTIWMKGRSIVMQLSFCWSFSFAMSSFLVLLKTHKASFPHQQSTASQSTTPPSFLKQPPAQAVSWLCACSRQKQHWRLQMRAPAL